MDFLTNNLHGLPPASSVAGFVAPEFHELSDTMRMALSFMLTCSPLAGSFARVYLTHHERGTDAAAMELSGLLMIARQTLTDDSCGHA